MIPFCNVIFIFISFFTLAHLVIVMLQPKLTKQPTDQTNWRYFIYGWKSGWLGQLCEHQKFRNAHTHTITLHLNIHSFHREYHSSLKISVFFMESVFVCLTDWLNDWIFFLLDYHFFFLPQKSSHSPKEIQWKKFYSNQPTKQNNIHEQWWWWFFEILHDSQRICCCCCRFSLLLLSIIISIMFWEKK